MAESRANTDGVELQRDVLCAVHDGVELRSDFYRPSGPGPHPAVVLIHGGGWKGESKVRSWQPWATYLAHHGYASLAARYRLSTDDEPMGMRAVHDVRAAVQWLRGCATDLDVDPARVGVLGDSAGGHLAAMLALTGRDGDAANPDDPHAAEPCTADVVVAVYGVFDMIAQWEHDQLVRPGDHITETYLGGTPMSHREDYYATSPLYHASTRNARGSAWLLVYGTADPVVDFRQSEVMAVHLQRAGATVRPLPVANASHFWLRETPIDADMAGNPTAYVAPRIVAFLDKHLR